MLKPSLMPRIPKRSLAACLLVMLASGPAFSQMFSYGGLERRATQAMSITTYAIDFEYDGEADLGPAPRLDWDGRAYGLSFNRRNFAAAVVFGSAKSVSGEGSDDLKLVDASLSGWGEVIRTQGSSASIGVPIVLHSGFRSVDGDFVNDFGESFSYTVVGLGTGVAVSAEPSPSVSIEAHAWPVIAMAFRSFEGFAGSSTMLDTDLQMHVMNVFGRYGISAGYGFRWQKWNTDDVVIMTNVSRDIFDYKSSQHMLRLGLNW